MLAGSLGGPTETRRDVMDKGSEVAGLRETETTDTAIGEATHLAGSAIVTAGVAAVLVVVAIPASIGLGIAAALKAVRRRR